MGRAHIAHGRDLFPESLARSMHPNGGVVRANPSLVGQICQAALLEVNRAQCLAILGLQYFEESGHAPADFAVERNICSCCASSSWTNASSARSEEPRCR